MPIAALPQNTVRAIGSTSVIADPCSIVKELLDNALDASASSVFVEISQNTLDVIQVKDNGHGISSEDHSVVCKRTFTSKIQTVDDLINIGGVSLGFRGEALASAAEMSGGLNVTTRVGAEMVGSSIKYGRDGEMISSQRTSHPVGTTVRITDFLKHIPVRRRTAIKGAGKTLSKIKKLLQTYAICQPSKRLSLKVLKTKNESNNFMYAGGQNAGLMDAALKVVGTEVASHCTIKEWPSDVNSAEYTLIALLAKEYSDFTKINNAGQYFSVDGRPLTSGRGIARDITKLYRNFLRSISSSHEGSTAINDPFLCLQIRCPPGSYDVNIEPAKDDVLFEDPQRVLSLVEELFGAAYGESAGPVENKKPSNKGKEKLTYNDGFELLMARKSPPPSPPRVNTTSEATRPSSIIPPEIFRKPLTSSSRGFDSGPRDENDCSQNVTPEGRGLEALNPWSMTKLSAPFRTSMRAQAGPSIVPIITNPAGREPVRRHRGSNQASPASTRSSALPSPSTSNANSNSTSTSLTKPGLSSSVEHHPQMSPTPSIQNHTIRQRERDRERYGNGALDTWFERITQPSLRQNGAPESEGEAQEPSHLAQARFGSSDQSPSDYPESAEDLFTQDDIDGTQANPAPSLPVSQDLESPKEPDRSAQITHRRQELSVLKKWSARLHHSSGTQQNPEVEQALDFERRKREAILKRREEMRNRAELPSSAKSPHHSRYLSARAALNPHNNEQQTQNSVTPDPFISKPALSPFDPRAYLIRQTTSQQESSRDGKARRIQTSKMPFEKIPEGQDLHDVCLTIPLDLTAFSTSVNENMEHDLYTQCGTEAEASMPSCPESFADLWRYRLSTLIAKNYNTGESGVPSLNFDFSTIHHLPDS